MNSVNANEEFELPSSSREPIDLKKANAADLMSCEMDLGSMLEKGANPFGDQNGLSEDFVFEGGSDPNMFGLNDSGGKDLEVLSTDGENDNPLECLAEDRPPSDNEDEPFEIEDLISSSDEEVLSVTNVNKEPKERTPSPEHLSVSTPKEWLDLSEINPETSNNAGQSAESEIPSKLNNESNIVESEIASSVEGIPLC